MKKYIILTILVLGLKIIVNAQSDAFFSYQYECRESDEWGELLILPPEHGLDYSYPADNVAMGTGLLVMTGFAMIYANTRKRK